MHTARNNRWMVIAAAGMLAAATACTSYIGVQPVSPKFGDTVAGLQPTITWEPVNEAGVTYDLVINAPSEMDAKGVKLQTKQMYYREGLAGTSHVVETPLEPGREYTWSIRVRKGNEVSDWTVRKFSIYTIVYDKYRTEPLLLKTPPETKPLPPMTVMPPAMHL